MSRLCVVLQFEELREAEKEVVLRAVEEAAIEGAKEALVRIGLGESTLVEGDTRSASSRPRWFAEDPTGAG